MSGMRFEGEQLREMPLHMQEQVAIRLIQPRGGIAYAPLIPGPRQDDYNVMEIAFHNGEASRTEQIISILMDRKSKAKGEVHAELVELIEIVRALC